MTYNRRPENEEDATLPFELEKRWGRLDEIMREKDLDALLIVGNSVVGSAAFGSFRYFTSHKVYYGYQAIVARPGKPIMVCASSVLHKRALTQKGFTDIRLSPDILGSVLSTLNEGPLRRLGVSLAVLPSSWYLELEKMNVTILDITEEVVAVRNSRSEYELQATRESARISDIGYKAMIDMARPGVGLSDLHTELDYVLKMAGAEETFTLMSNGKFSFEDNKLPCISAYRWPDDRVIEHGDCVAMEITPRYKGYWTQMVRTICVGEENPDLRIAHKAQVEVIESVVKLLKPGVRLDDVLTHMWEAGKDLGFIAKLPSCHLAGIDLDEGWQFSMESDIVLMENMTFILHPTLITPKIDFGIFWGESYLVTNDGGLCLASSGNELITV